MCNQDVSRTLSPCLLVYCSLPLIPRQPKLLPFIESSFLLAWNTDTQTSTRPVQRGPCCGGPVLVIHGLEASTSSEEGVEQAIQLSPQGPDHLRKPFLLVFKVVYLRVHPKMCVQTGLRNGSLRPEESLGGIVRYLAFPFCSQPSSEEAHAGGSAWPSLPRPWLRAHLF